MFERLRKNSRHTRSQRTCKPTVQQLEDRCVPANVTPVLTSLHAVVNGSIVQLSGAFEDSDAADPHSVILDWKDSTPAQSIALPNGARSFQVEHNYGNRQSALDKVNAIGVTVTDQAFASQVVETVGVFDDSDFRTPTAVLGEPTRFTSRSSPYGGAVTPFNAPFGGDEILMLNAGESITVKFPVKVFDRPASDHFGADFLVFGNAFYFFDFDTGRATGGVYNEPGQIEVSQDGITFFALTNTFADIAFPTNGYRNPTGPFDVPPANPLLSDFGLPVDLSFDETGLNLAQIVAAYNGSGGGTPVDISSTGLEWIQYVRLHGAVGGVEIDAVSVVNPLPPPAPAADFVLANLDQSLGLYVDSTGYFQSTGTSVKWLVGATNVHRNTWYFLKTNGDLFAWNGRHGSLGRKLALGTLVTHLDPQVFVHPETLFDASTASLSGADAARAPALDEALGLFVGATGFRNGTNAPQVKWLRGVVNAFGNTWYFIRPNGDFVAWNGRAGARGALLHHFAPQLFLDPQLLYDASQATLSVAAAGQAQQLDEALGLYIDVQGVFPNVRGTNAKWLRGQPNAFGNTWYFIRSSGEFVAWNGRKNAAGQKVAVGAVLNQFDVQAFLNPQLLVQAAQPVLPANQVVQARQFQASLGLFVDAAGFLPDVRGTSAKWLRGQANGFGNTWYFIRSNGEFVAWNGRTDAAARKLNTGVVLFRFDPQVFLNPEPLL